MAQLITIFQINDFNSVPDASQMRFGIVVSEWNHNITGALLEGAVNTLKKSRGQR